MPFQTAMSKLENGTMIRTIAATSPTGNDKQQLMGSSSSSKFV